MENKITDNEHGNRLVKTTFYVTYVFLLTTATITFIEAMRTNVSRVRHILNLETCISVVAAYFYGVFMEKINKQENVDYKEINIVRYTDWAITTPIMLLVLCLAFLYNLNPDKGNPSKYIPSKFSFFTFLIVLAMNFAMLTFGYLGEVDLISRNNAMIGGFAGFFALYYFLYNKFLKGKKSFDNQLLYWAFFIFWSGYGILYMMEDSLKNAGYNILDLFSKCFVGIFFWAYFTKTFQLN